MLKEKCMSAKEGTNMHSLEGNDPRMQKSFLSDI